MAKTFNLPSTWSAPESQVRSLDCCSSLILVTTEPRRTCLGNKYCFPKGEKKTATTHKPKATRLYFGNERPEWDGACALVQGLVRDFNDIKHCRTSGDRAYPVTNIIPTNWWLMSAIYSIAFSLQQAKTCHSVTERAVCTWVTSLSCIQRRLTQCLNICLGQQSML